MMKDSFLAKVFTKPIVQTATYEQLDPRHHQEEPREGIWFLGQDDGFVPHPARVPVARLLACDCERPLGESGCRALTISGVHGTSCSPFESRAMEISPTVAAAVGVCLASTPPFQRDLQTRELPS